MYAATAPADRVIGDGRRGALQDDLAEHAGRQERNAERQVAHQEHESHGTGAEQAGDDSFFRAGVVVMGHE